MGALYGKLSQLDAETITRMLKLVNATRAQGIHIVQEDLIDLDRRAKELLREPPKAPIFVSLLSLLVF